MNKDIVRAWKDPMTRELLAAADTAFHPAGLVELSDADLRDATGASIPVTTAITCTEYSFHGWKSCCP